MKTNLRLYINRTIGFIGMLFPISANFLPPGHMRESFFVIGSILMLGAALVENALFFTLLQIIVLIGASTAFTPWSLEVKASLPLVATAICLYILSRRQSLKDPVTIIGLSLIHI